jgi:hypothetical protein
MSHVSDKIGDPCSAQNPLLSGQFDSGGKRIAPTCHVYTTLERRLAVCHDVNYIESLNL